jgi:hypothetical protein
VIAKPGIALRHMSTHGYRAVVVYGIRGRPWVVPGEGPCGKPGRRVLAKGSRREGSAGLSQQWRPCASDSFEKLGPGGPAVQTMASCKRQVLQAAPSKGLPRRGTDGRHAEFPGRTDMAAQRWT